MKPWPLPGPSSASRVVLVCPTTWDTAQLPTLPPIPYEVGTYGENVEHEPSAFDADLFIDEAVRSLGSAGIDGVTSSGDYPGALVAAFIAHELGLPGPDPESVLRCSHKYYARLAQREAVPEATPRFALIDPGQLDEDSLALRFPLFVKPVKSWFSQYARRVDTFEQLRRFVRSPGVRAHLATFVRPLDQLLARYPRFAFHGGYMLAEELLTGHQVTLEGLVQGGAMHIVGIVDSVMYQGTLSFKRFDYPSSVSASVARRMTVIAERVMTYIGFDNGLFNIELFYDERTDDVHIVEINPRMCAQFADLMESVNGTNTYELLVAVAAGRRAPVLRRRARFSVATSFVLRHFTDATVAAVPDTGRIEAIRARFPVTLVSTSYRQGQHLSDIEYESDGYSYRYAVLNIAGADKESLERDLAGVRGQLGFRLEPVETDPAATR
jgi:biotin carboxylase